jgi:putative membrane-bound dehydrogenase-like protein
MTRNVVVRSARLVRNCVCLLLLALVLWPAQLGAQAPGRGRLKVLFLGDNGHHRPYQRAKETLAVLAQNGIDLFYTDERDDLNPAELDKYHVLMLYNNHTTVSPTQLASLLEFVRDGGGLVVVHCASASFQNSEEFIKLVGAAFKTHGTGTFSVKRAVSNHPAIRGVPSFETWDETYVHTKHNPVNRTVLEVRSADGHDEPWTWVKSYGSGRVYYTAWGHDERTWTNAGFQQQLMQAAKWAAGDWALNQRLAEPNPQQVDLEAPIPTYARPPAAWNTPAEPVTKAPVALPTDQSLQLATLRPGFRVEPFAFEPMIGNIIDFAWDARGRMWAIETNDYPNKVIPDSVVLPSAGPYPGAGDRILIIEDRNGDNRADAVKVFAEGMNLATSLVLANGGVIVAQAPHMLFFKDTNGDDRADTRTILFTGFPRTDTHGTISNLRWGFDNQILASLGYNGFRGEVGGKEFPRTGLGSVGAGYFRFAADGSSFDYLARTSNNTWGVALSEDGFIFGSTANRRPSNFVHIPGRYYRDVLQVREPVLPGIEDRSDVYAIREIWQVDQFDMYTAGAAHEIYTARLFPQEYWNRIGFVVEPTAHVVGMFELLPNGSAFIAKNRWNLMSSRDAWAAPVQVKVGPDGALWVSDFYTLIGQHNPVPKCCGFTNGPGQAYETPNRDRLHGRMYRILPENTPSSRAMRLDNATPQQLVTALKHDNLFWRLTAQQRLVEGKHSAVVPALVQLLNDHTSDALGLNVGALHALWTLHGLGALGPNGNASALAAARNALHHPAASVRRAALQILPRDEQLLRDIFAAGILPDRSVPANMEYTVGTGVLQDADPHVRLEALLVLAELPPSPQAAAALADVLFFPPNARDLWIPDAVAIAGVKQGPQFAADVLKRRLPQNADTLAINGIRGAVRLMALHYAQQTNVDAVVAMLSAVPETNPAFATAVFNAIAPQPPPEGAPPQQMQAFAGMGWPQDRPPTLSAEQRAALVAAFRAAPPELAEGFHRVAARWGIPDLFR